MNPLASFKVLSGFVAVGVLGSALTGWSFELDQVQSSGTHDSLQKGNDQQLHRPASRTVAMNDSPLAADSAESMLFPVGNDAKAKSIKWVNLLSRSLGDGATIDYSVYVFKGRKSVRVGRLSINCESKLLAYRSQAHARNQKTRWIPIETKSPVEALALYECRRTSASARWGFPESTNYLWGSLVPTSDPANATGKWVAAINNDEAESFWNKSIVRMDDAIAVPTYSRSKNLGAPSGAVENGEAQYGWLIASCRENLYSVSYRPYPLLRAIWSPPRYGRPGGVSMIVRSKYCQ